MPTYAEHMVDILNEMRLTCVFYGHAEPLEACFFRVHPEVILEPRLGPLFQHRMWIYVLAGLDRAPHFFRKQYMYGNEIEGPNNSRHRLRLRKFTLLPEHVTH